MEGEIVPAEIIPAEELRAMVRREGGYMAPRAIDGQVANPEGLRKAPKGKKIVKTREGRGGRPIRYVGWTNTADLLDEGLGVGNWGWKQLQMFETEKPDPKDESKNITEISVMIEFDARGLYMPIQVWGYGDYYSRDRTAHKTDAIETAISRAITKAGARISPLLRQVWANDDEAMKQMKPPSEAQVKGVNLIFSQLDSMGKTEQVDALVKSKGYGDRGELTKAMTEAEMSEFQKEAAELLTKKNGNGEKEKGK